MNLEDECPRCFYRTDSVARASGSLLMSGCLDWRTRPQKPAARPGDVTICLNCAGIFIFSDQMQMREMNEEEAAPILADAAVQKIAALIKSRGPLRRPAPAPWRPRKSRG
jgi:hypothetical protein